MIRKHRPDQYYVRDDPETLKLLRRAANRIGKMRDPKAMRMLNYMVRAYGRFGDKTTFSKDQKALLIRLLPDEE